jgi:hypothetical protein
LTLHADEAISAHANPEIPRKNPPGTTSYNNTAGLEGRRLNGADARNERVASVREAYPTEGAVVFPFETEKVDLEVYEHGEPSDKRYASGSGYQDASSHAWDVVCHPPQRIWRI